MQTDDRSQEAIRFGRLKRFRKRKYQVAQNRLEFEDIEVEFETAERPGYLTLKGFVIGVAASLVAAAIWSLIEIWL